MTPVHIAGIARRTFHGPAAIAARPEHHAHLAEYLSDLVAPYGVPLRDLGADDAAGHSYGEMAAALVEDLVTADDPVDLLVLAFAVPDVRPGRATATYLSHLCPGDPLGFAVCDQGSAAAFTGLRIIDAYARDDQVRRALLLVVEQAGLPYDPGVVGAAVDPAAMDPAAMDPAAARAALPAGHTAVGLRCDRTGPARVASIRQHPDVPSDQVPDRLAAALADAGVDGESPVLVADPALAEGADRAVPVDPARPHTGVWWALADALADAPGAAPGGAPGGEGGPERLLLADYDRRLTSLSLATIEVAA